MGKMQEQAGDVNIMWDENEGILLALMEAIADLVSPYPSCQGLRERSRTLHFLQESAEGDLD